MAYPYRVSSPYGRRASDPDGFHQGVDFATPYGSPLYAPRDGRLIQYPHHSIYGMRVGVRWGNYEAFVAHCSESHGRDGRLIRAGELIARSGNSGRSSGPHTHFEVRLRGYHVNPMPHIGSLFEKRIEEEEALTPEQMNELKAHIDQTVLRGVRSVVRTLGLGGRVQWLDAYPEDGEARLYSLKRLHERIEP